MTVQPAGDLASRARHLTSQIPDSPDSARRLAATAAAVDHLIQEFPSEPAVACASLARAMAAASERAVTREMLLRTGLETCVRGAAAGLPALAGAALHMAALGWDVQDEARLLEAAYRHLMQEQGLGTAVPVALKVGELGEPACQREVLEAVSAGLPVDLQDLGRRLSACLPRTEAGGDICRDLVRDLAARGPEAARPAYELADTMMGRWWWKLDDSPLRAIGDAFLSVPVADASEAGQRAAAALMGMEYDTDLAAGRALDYFEKRARGADAALLGLARLLADRCGGHAEGPKWRRAIRVAALEQVGRHRQVTGPLLAGTLARMLEGVDYTEERQRLAGPALARVSEELGDNRWKAALAALGRLTEAFHDYLGTGLEVCRAGLEALSRLTGEQDPVEAVVRAAGSVGQMGNPLAEIENFLARREAGLLKNSQATLEMLAILAEEGSTAQVRATARLLHRHLNRQNAPESLKVSDLLEIAHLARAAERSAPAPEAIRTEDDSVRIGDVVIRRKTGPAAA
jgi:hypothetical protein